MPRVWVVVFRHNLFSVIHRGSSLITRNPHGPLSHLTEQIDSGNEKCAEHTSSPPARHGSVFTQNDVSSKEKCSVFSLARTTRQKTGGPHLAAYAFNLATRWLSVPFTDSPNTAAVHSHKLRHRRPSHNFAIININHCASTMAVWRVLVFNYTLLAD